LTRAAGNIVLMDLVAFAVMAGLAGLTFGLVRLCDRLGAKE
jgi:hypothetical protein